MKNSSNLLENYKQMNINQIQNANNLLANLEISKFLGHTQNSVGMQSINFCGNSNFTIFTQIISSNHQTGKRI